MVKEIKISELVLDFDLYPRHQIDTQHAGRMAEAERAGAKFPPILIDKASRRVVDGFHRVRKQRIVHGKDAKIAYEGKEYESDACMFLDAMRLNSAHGEGLTSFDRTRCVLQAARLGISLEATAEALHMTTQKLGKVRTDRSALVGKLPVPLKRTIRHMHGRSLTKKQAEVNEQLGGMEQYFYVDQLIKLLEGNLLDRSDEHLMEAIERLAELLEKELKPVMA